MKLIKDKNTSEYHKSSTWIHGHRYLFFHLFEIVFAVILVYCVLCECGLISEKLNITSYGFYESLESWFQQTKYHYSIISSIVEDVSDSLNVEGEIIIEITESSGKTFDFMNQIIIILLPLMVTLIALSFALLPKKIYGVMYSDLRRLGVNKAYSFLSMIFISIFLFVGCIVCYYFDFALCTIVIDFIAIVYIVLFLSLEIPLLSRNSKRVNRIAKNAFFDVYFSKSNKKSPSKKTKSDLNTLAYNSIIDRGIYDVFTSYFRNKHRRNSKDANILFNIYVEEFNKDIFSVSDDRRRKMIDDFINNINEYLKIYNLLNASYTDETYSHISNEAYLVWNFVFDCLRLENNDFDRNELRRLLLNFCIHDNLSYPRLMIQTDMKWLYSTNDLYKIGFTNGLLIFALCTENIPFLNVFLDVYLGEISLNIKERPDYYYFVFFTIYLFHCVENNSNDDLLKNIQCDMNNNSVYKEAMINSLYFEDMKPMAFYLVTLLKHLIDSYRTLPEDVGLQGEYIDNINWHSGYKNVLPIGKFVPFTTDDICNWWITYLLISSIKDIDTLEKQIKEYLTREEISFLSNAYTKYWLDNSGNFQQLDYYNSYFASLINNVDVSEDKKKQINDILHNICVADTKETIESGESPTDNSNKNKNKKESAKKSKSTNSKKKQKANKRNSVLIQDFVNYHATKQEFYSNERPKDETHITKVSHDIFFSRDGAIIDGLNTPHFAFLLYYDENGYYNYHDQFLYNNMCAYFMDATNPKKSYEEIYEYTEKIDRKISKFSPDKKFAPYSKWMLDSEVRGKYDSYKKILDVENTRTNLINDTYIKNGAIKFYINCQNVSEITIPTKEEIKKMIENGVIRYSKTSDGKYRFHTQPSDKYFTIDELVELLDGKVRKVTITMEYSISYDEKKIRIYKIK